MDSTGGMEKESMPSPPTARYLSLSGPFPTNDFDTSATLCKENDGTQRPEPMAAAVSSSNARMLSNGINTLCNTKSSTSSTSNVGNMAKDIFGTKRYANNSSNHHTVNGHDSSNRSGNAVNIAGPLTSGTTYSDPIFPRLQGGNAVSTDRKNRAGISINYDSLSSLELEMTYDPHGCIYGPEGCLTPDSTWKRHLEFLADVPQHY